MFALFNYEKKVLTCNFHVLIELKMIARGILIFQDTKTGKSIIEVTVWHLLLNETNFAP